VMRAAVGGLPAAERARLRRVTVQKVFSDTAATATSDHAHARKSTAARCVGHPVVLSPHYLLSIGSSHSDLD